MNARASSVELGEQAPTSARAHSLFDVLADLVRLTKPRITALVIVTGLGGTWLARRTGSVGAIDWQRALLGILGVVLVVSGANALNMYFERDVDALMTRTQDRPLPAQRLHPRLALGFGLTIGFGSLPLLWLGVNSLTALLAAGSLVAYVWIYTPVKRVTPWAVAIGAVPGAMPPLLGWTAVTGSLGRAGLALFAVLFFWQLPHFLAIATFRRDEYTRAGIKVLPAIQGDRVTRAYASFFSLALVAASLSLVPFGVGGWFYLASAVVLGGLFMAASVRTGDSVRWARSLFFASLIYLPMLIAAMMVGA
jgi:protoheme IX farnesyltransferase